MQTEEEGVGAQEGVRRVQEPLLKLASTALWRLPARVAAVCPVLLFANVETTKSHNLQ